MTDTESRYWNFLECYKGYLPAKEAAAAQQYVVLACKLNFTDTNKDVNINGNYNREKESKTNGFAALTQESNQNKLSEKHNCDNNHTSNDCDGGVKFENNSVITKNTNGSVNINKHDVDACNNCRNVHGSITHNSSSDDRSFRDRWNESSQRVECSVVEQEIGFFMLRKDDVVAPPLKYTLSLNKVGHCFLACERQDCECDAPHIKFGAWRMRLDTLPIISIIVNDHGHNRKLNKSEIKPTAGYYFALGLKTLNIVQAVVPTFCRFNQSCRHSCSCLYIHASVESRPRALYKSEIALRNYDTIINGESDVESNHEMRNGDGKQRDAFYDYMESIGMETVGDVQVLSVIAFESLASRIPTNWAELFLATTVVRNIDVKSLLTEALMTFPRVRLPLQLPESLSLVRDLLALTPIQFYNTNLSPQVMDACEIIRMRFKRDEEYKVITLRKEPTDSFFVRITHFIVNFAPRHAHCSWRKHDPQRPVVTSLITYVDVTQCRCRDDLERSYSGYSYGNIYESKANDNASQHGSAETQECTSHSHHKTIDNTEVIRTESQLIKVDNNDATSSNVVRAVSSSHVKGKTCNVDNAMSDYIGRAIQEQRPLTASEDFGVPRESWCVCQRHWAIAVNYELSTPSGSRCSEQNAMGKLAAIGQPTWSVREVFVHGVNCKREVNPLFPCGVCENMLQKVNRDVHSHYGQDVTLYMFDAAMPRKIVYLPIPEISNRDGSSFKRFVASDLRTDECTAPPC